MPSPPVVAALARALRCDDDQRDHLSPTSSRRPGDTELSAPIRDLRSSSAEFRALWERHDVAVRRFDRKNVLRPEVGLIPLRCEVLWTVEEAIRLIAFLPVEGTGAAHRLDLVRVIGSRHLHAAG